MTDNPLPTTDSAASTTAAVIDDAVKASETTAETAILTAEPWMGTIIIKQIWEGILNFVFGYVGNALAKLGGFVCIDIQKYVALQKAASALVALQSAQKSGDPHAISQANSAADQAAAPILHYVGSVNT